MPQLPATALLLLLCLSWAPPSLVVDTMGAWRTLDLFPKIPTDLSQSTAVGGWFSAATGVVMLLLFQVELYSFVSAPIDSYVVVDNAIETKARKTRDCTYCPHFLVYRYIDKYMRNHCCLAVRAVFLVPAIALLSNATSFCT